MSLHIRNIILNAQDLERAKSFWMAALGYIVLEESEGWVYLGDPAKYWVRLGLQQTNEPKTVLNRLHFDLQPEDGVAEVERLLSLGATIPAWHYNDNPDYLVMRDPEGNEFCLANAALESYRKRL